MAHVRYQQGAQIGGSHIQVQRNENCFEDWNWRTFKFWSAIFGWLAFGVLLVLLGGWLFGGHYYVAPTTRPVRVVRTTPIPPPPPIPSSVTVKTEPVKVEVEVKTPTPPPAPPPIIPSATGLPPNVW